MRVKFFLLVLVFCGLQALSAEHIISSAAELSALNLQPGDVVLLKNGNWKDQKLHFKANGTEAAPISLKAMEPGKVLLKGSSSLLIDGNWLVVEGLQFSEGFLKNRENVITFSEASSDCRLTNSAIIDYNPSDTKSIFNFWVLIYGIRNRMDHCYIKGKTTRGTTVGVNISDKPNYHRIDHNYFGHRPDVKANGGETIRIGTDVWSMHDSYTTVEDNIFEHCDGEIEVVSNKSGNNIIRNNLFYESKGTLTLRHGNSAKVYGNYFIGNGIEGTGGIRVIGENHQIHDNYFSGLTGTGLKAVISLMNAWENPPLHGYWQVKNASISGNTIVNCKQVFVIGAGKDEKTVLPPTATSINNNTLIANSSLIEWIEPSAEIKFYDNISSKNKAGEIPKAKKMKADLKSSEFGLFRVGKNQNPKSPNVSALFNGTDIGVSWMSFNVKRKAKAEL